MEEVCRKMSISEAIFYNWKKKYGGLAIIGLRMLRQLEEENQHLWAADSGPEPGQADVQDVLKKL